MTHFAFTAKCDAYLSSFERWLHSRRPASREMRAATLDDLVGNQVPLTPLERQRARQTHKRRHDAHQDS